MAGREEFVSVTNRGRRGRRCADKWGPSARERRRPAASQRRREGGSARARPGLIGPLRAGWGRGKKKARLGEGEWAERVGEERGGRGAGLAGVFFSFFSFFYFPKHFHK